MARKTIKGMPVKAYWKAYYEANKEKIKAYYEANKEKIAEREKAYYEANKEKIKAYYEANKEKIAERAKARYKICQNRQEILKQLPPEELLKNVGYYQDEKTTKNTKL